ncbi:MAG TPA: cation diffusion facilitator family transporter [Nitrospinota bacterium]|nr:cation diffusion facilitator family transporter [Nitrospinota bacterium]
MDKEERYQKGRRVTILALIINFLLTVFKLFAGILGKSHVLIADAIHSLSDFITDFIVLAGLKFSSKPKDERHPYGHGKIETVTTGIIGIGLIIIGLKIGYDGVLASINPMTIPTSLALFAAIISIIVKEAIYRYTVFIGKRINSPSIIANAWHHRSDALSSIAALIGISGAQMGLAFLDPLAAVFVAILIVKVGGEITLNSFKELIETSVDKELIKEIESTVLSISDVKEAHKIKARNVGTSIIIELHIEVDEDMTVKKGHDIAKEVEYTLKTQFQNVESVTVHVCPAKTLYGASKEKLKN